MCFSVLNLRPSHTFIMVVNKPCGLCVGTAMLLGLVPEAVWDKPVDLGRYCVVCCNALKVEIQHCNNLATDSLR